MTSQLFAVMRTLGTAWNNAAVAARLGADCWSIRGLLQTLWIKPWGLGLGSLGP